jgi:hypothetical protein
VDIEWRRLPELPQYEMNQDGAIRHRQTQYVRKVQVNNHGTPYFNFVLPNGQRVSRTLKTLKAAAFPELAGGVHTN